MEVLQKLIHHQKLKTLKFDRRQKLIIKKN